MSNWYMRDNHTFRKLEGTAEEAKLAIREEFAKGYTHGMICTHDQPVKSRHARGNIDEFLSEVEGFYSKLAELSSSGAGI